MHFQISNDIEHHVLCLLPISTLSFEKCLIESFAHFSSFSSQFVRFLYISWALIFSLTNPLLSINMSYLSR